MNTSKLLKPLALAMCAAVIGLGLGAGTAAAYSANKVWYELRPSGIFRVYVSYTVPELKEFRESYVEFRKKKAAEKFYWDLVRGADFYPPAPNSGRFSAAPTKPDPW